MNAITGQWIATPPCMICGERAQVELTAEEWAAVQAGKLIQDALPERDAAFRELFLSGTHEHCWEIMFAGEES